MVSVYVAASSNDLDRAEQWTTVLRLLGITVTSTWIPEVRAHGGGNPPDATKQERRQWAYNDLCGVEEADILWVLMPPGRSDGAFVELGYALKANKTVVTSGAYTSIFGDLVDNYAQDVWAFAQILKLTGVVNGTVRASLSSPVAGQTSQGTGREPETNRGAIATHPEAEVAKGRGVA